MKASIVVSLSFILLSGCKNTGSFTSGDKKESGSADGTNSSLVASGQTSVKVTPASNIIWKDFTINLGADFLDSNICSGKSIFGRAGTALCGGSTWTVSTLGLDSSNVGSITGSTYTYTAAANIAHNVINLNMGSDFLVTNICSTKSILSLTGTAICGAVFGDLTASNMHRNVATAQMTLTTETSTSSYASGYRDVSDTTKDDDGGDVSSSLVKATRPARTCGTIQATVVARIAHCLDQNGTDATWEGATKGIAGEGTWKLVTRTGGLYEVWRDERTGLLWGDSVTNSWCRASGNAQTAAQDGTVSGICDPSDPNGYGAQDATPTSVCVENGSLQPALGGENWATGVYDGSKGGMGAVGTPTSPSVKWRLPTKYDWQTADNDGIRFVLPNMFNSFWSATVFSNIREYAWYFDGYYGGVYNIIRSTRYEVRCLGR